MLIFHLWQCQSGAHIIVCYRHGWLLPGVGRDRRVTARTGSFPATRNNLLSGLPVLMTKTAHGYLPSCGTFLCSKSVLMLVQGSGVLFFIQIVCLYIYFCIYFFTEHDIQRTPKQVLDVWEMEPAAKAGLDVTREICHQT